MRRSFADMRIPGLLLLSLIGAFWSVTSAADLRMDGRLADGPARLRGVGPTALTYRFSLPLTITPVRKNVLSSYQPATLRRYYELAAADKAAGEKFYKLLADYQDRDALVLGYKAASEAIRARDASMFNKLTYVQDAAKTFEQAVGLAPQNPEIRFLRFSVESNLPAFLGLSKHVDEDKELLLNAALSHPKSGLDTEAFRTVRSFLVARGHVSDEQAQRLSKVKE